MGREEKVEREKVRGLEAKNFLVQTFARGVKADVCAKKIILLFWSRLLLLVSEYLEWLIVISAK